MDEGYMKRGVENPAIVDLIRPAEGRYGVVLVMLEDRPWSGGEEQLQQLDAKLNAYFTYVIDGHLTEQYPEYTGVPVQIELQCVAEPGEVERAMLREATRLAGQYGMRFVVRVVAPQEVPRAPWESGGGESAPAAGEAAPEGPPYRYREEVLGALEGFGLRPGPATPPAKVRQLLDALYLFEIRELRAKRRELEEFFGPQPLDDYAAEVQALRRKYAPLSLPLQRWTEPEKVPSAS